MKEPKKNWTNILFLTATPILGVLGTLLYSLRFGVTWWEPALCLAFYLAIGFSVTAGYHRYFSHKSFECHPVIQALFLFFGAMALENSLLEWASDHRNHHRYVDTDGDPYNINRGGWWAHITWIFYSNPDDSMGDNARDLRKNRLVMWQHRWSVWIGIIAGLGLPTLMGALLGHPLGGLLWGGFLRIVIVHHTTFLVNSVAHMYGTRPYSDETTARDNWMLAFVTHGEGYHNFHHKFPSDYRNGVRWFDWDPTKWLIRGLQAVGLVKNTKWTPQAMIDRARLRMMQLHADSRMQYATPELNDAYRVRLQNAHELLEQAIASWNEAQARYREMKARSEKNAAALARLAKEKIRAYEACLAQARIEWQQALRILAQVPEAV